MNEQDFNRLMRELEKTTAINANIAATLAEIKERLPEPARYTLMEK